MNDEQRINPNYNQYNVVNLPKALQILIDVYIKPFYFDHELDRIEFREDKLWQKDIDLVFSINKEAIQEIHTMLGKRNTGHKVTSTADAVTISLADCERLV